MGRAVALRRVHVRSLASRGVHHFAPVEVRVLAQALKRGKVRLTRLKFQSPDTPAECSHEDDLAQLRNEFMELRTVAAIAVDLLFDFAPLGFLRKLDPDLLEALLAVNDRK